MKLRTVLPHTVFQTKSLNPSLPVTSAAITKPGAVTTTQAQPQTQPEPQSVDGVVSNILNNMNTAYAPTQKDINDYANHRWMKNYFEIVPEANIEAASLKDLDYYAKNFGIDTSVSNLKKKFDDATELAYAQKNKEFQRSEDQYYQNMAAQNAQYQQGVQNAMSQALASGSSRGMQFANQFAAQNELARANATGALDLATQRNNLKAQEAEAYARNAIDAEQTAYDRRANILGQAVADRANEVQRYAADTTLYSNEVSARLNNYQYNLNKFYDDYMNDKTLANNYYSQIATDALNLYGSQYTADKNFEGTKYNADSNREASEYTADKNYAGTVYNADANLEGTKYNADKNYAGTVGAASIGAAASRYVADRNLEGTKYNADKNFEGTQYNADKNYAGTVYNADKNFEGTQYNADAYNKNNNNNNVETPTAYTRDDILEAYYTAKQSGDFGRMAELEHAFPFVSTTQEYASANVKDKVAEAKETGAAVPYTSVLGNQRYALPNGTTVTEEQYNKMKKEEENNKNKTKENKNLYTKSGIDYTASKYPGL